MNFETHIQTFRIELEINRSRKILGRPSEGSLCNLQSKNIPKILVLDTLIWPLELCSKGGQEEKQEEKKEDPFEDLPTHPWKTPRRSLEQNPEADPRNPTESL